MCRRMGWIAIVGVLVAAPRAAAEPASPSGPGLSAGSEIMFFKPFAEAGSVPNEILSSTGADEFLPAWRLWCGFLDEEGFGSRVRWWQYDHFSADAAGYESRLVFQKLDWEATQQVSFRRWRMLLSGGLTYVANELRDTQPDGSGPSYFHPARYRFDGVGITAGLQAIRTSTRHPALSLCGTAQWSAAYGNGVGTQFDFVPNSATFRALEGTVAGVLELSVGPRWERALDGGAVVFAGGNAEAQLWSSGLGATAYSLLPFYQRFGDVGLVGLTVNAGFRR